MDITYIADPCSNYIGEMNNLKELATVSKQAGATHFKPQIYSANELYTQKDNPYYKLQEKCSLTFDQVEEIFNYCNDIKIKPMFSCFNSRYFDWLESIGCDTLKIAASQAGNSEFVKKASEYGFDVTISVSPEHHHFTMWQYTNIFNNVKFMACRSLYPSSITDYRLENIRCLDGVSCHCPDINLAIASASVGATIIEKHINTKYYDTPDLSSSISDIKFKQMVDICNSIEKIRGK